MAALTFQQWLQQQRHRPDPVGDLAKDAAHDHTKPSGPTTIDAWRRYLVRRGASLQAQRALARAWREYEKEVETCQSPKT
jgi:uncharacterized protein YozE (UPF0346 family)